MKHKKKLIGAIMLIVGLVLITTLRNKEVPQSQGLVAATGCPEPTTFSTTCTGTAVLIQDPGGDPQACRDDASWNCIGSCVSQLGEVCYAYCQTGGSNCQPPLRNAEVTGCVGEGPNEGLCVAYGSANLYCACNDIGTNGPQP